MYTLYSIHYCSILNFCRVVFWIFSLLKWFFRVFHARNFFFAGNNRRIHVTERIEMGPMTLRDYINTLEPYDPEKHGWRGEEPWRYRIRYKDSSEQSVHVLSEFKTSFNQLNNYQHTNHVIFHETPVWQQENISPPGKYNIFCTLHDWIIIRIVFSQNLIRPFLYILTIWLIHNVIVRV